MMTNEIAVQMLDKAERNLHELRHKVIGMVKELETLREENDRLSRRNTELETQMRRMVADKGCTGCDWRDQDGA